MPLQNCDAEYPDLKVQAGLDPLQSCFVLGRLWVRYGWHFTQAVLMDASVRVGGEHPKLKEMLAEERHYASLTYRQICRRAAALLRNSEVEALDRSSSDGFSRIQIDDYLSELFEVSNQLTQHYHNESSEDLVGDFFRRIWSPHLDSVETALRDGFDEDGSRFFDLGVATERILCPQSAWLFMTSRGKWRKAVRDEHRRRMQSDEWTSEDDDISCLEFDRQTGEERVVRFVRFACRPGCAGHGRALELLRGRLDAIAAINCDIAFKALAASFDGSSKPVSPDVAILNVERFQHAVLEASGVFSNTPEPLTYLDFVFDFPSGRVSRKGTTHAVRIPAGPQIEILRMLFNAQGELVEHVDIEKEVVMRKGENSLHKTVSRLRSELKQIGLQVENKEKKGYFLTKLSSQEG